MYLMIMQKTKTIRYDPKGEAVRREQQRNADLDREERNKLFPTIFVRGYGFRPYYSGHDTVRIKGSLCPETITKDRTCLAPLTTESAQSSKANCEVCGRIFDLSNSCEELKNIANKSCKSLLHSEAQLITLDVPYEAVKAVPVDVDHEEVRYDPDDIPPGEILAEIKAVFAQTKEKLSMRKSSYV